LRQSQRDEGLLRAIGPAGLAASIICQTIGAGIFAVPAVLAANAGVYAPLALLGCGLAIGAVAICFAEGGSRIPTSGGPYGYIEAAFGPLTGYVAGTMLWVSNVLACGGVAAALADTVAILFPTSLNALVRAVVIVGALGGVAAVNIGGVARGAGLIKAMTVVKLLPLLVFITVGAGAIHGANFSQATLHGTEGLGRAVILALFAYTGLEVALSASGEVARPNRTIPRALAIAMLSLAALYVAIQVVAQGILGAALAHSSVPLADAMRRISPTLAALMLAGAALSMFGMLSSDLLGSPRQLFAFGRDGLLPRALGRVHSRSRAPYVAILCYAGLAAVLALTGTFAELAVLAALATATVYAAGCAAAWQLARRGVALAGVPLQTPLLGAAAAVGRVSMLGLIALGSRQEILGLVALGAASALVYLIQAHMAPVRE
jgi:APA family basic amino acid/polyamine antiporter